MNPPKSPLSLKETYWQCIIIALSGAVILITVWCLLNGITTIFMLLYYFPIVLLAYRYRWKGCGLATLLALAYLGLVVIFDAGQADVILGAFYRFLVFVGIAAVIAYLSEQLKERETHLNDVGEMAHVGGWELDVRTKAVRWTKETYRIHDISEDENFDLSKAVLFFDLPDRSTLEAALKRCREPGEPFDLELPFTSAKGRHLWTRATGRAVKAGGKVVKLTGTFQDITERRQAKEAVMGSEDRYRNLYESTHDAIMTLEPPSWRFTTGNPATVQMFMAKDEADFTSREPGMLSPERQPDGRDSGEKAREMIETAMRDGTHFFEWTHRRLNGEDFPATVLLSKGELAGKVFLQATVRDISEVKRIAESLRESEERYRTLAEASPDQIFIIGRDDTMKYVNPASLKLFRLPYDQVVGTPRKNLFPPDIAEAQGILLKKTFETGELVKSEEKIQFGTQEFWIDTSFVPIKDVAGNATAVLGIARDITERKAAEEEIRISTMILRTQQETSPDGILIVDKSGKIISFNHRFTEIWGIPQDVIDSRSDERSLSFVLDKLSDPQEFLARVRYLYEHQQEKSHEEILLKDGKVLERYSAPMLGEDNRYFGRVWYFHDITERKRAEEALLESEEKYREFFTTSRDCVFITSPGGQWIDFNDVALEMFGYASREELSKVPISQLYENPSERTAVLNSIIRQGYAKEFPARLRRKDGGVIDTLITTVPVKNLDGSTQAFVGTIRDISDRKRAEEALLESEERFRGITERISDLIFMVDPEGYPTFMSPSVTAILGFSPESYIGKRPGPDIIHREDIVKIGKAMENLKNGSPEEQVEFRMMKRDGSFAVFDGKGIPVFIHGIYSGVQIVGRDITERRQAEEALRESEKKYRTLFENMLEGFAYCRMIYDDEGRPVDWIYLDVNKAFEELTGLKDITAKHVLEAIPDIRKQTPELFNAYGRVASGGHPEMFEIDFKPLKQWLKVSVFSPEKGYFVAVFEDVTERRRAEEALQESEKKYHGLYDSMMDAFATVAMDGRIMLFNESFREMIGYEKDEVYNLTYSDLTPDKWHAFEAEIIKNQVLMRGYSEIYEKEYRRKDGTVFPVELRTFLLKDDAGNPQGMSSIVRDITGRRQAEAAILESRQILEGILNTIPVRIFWKDKELTYLGCNTPFARDAGFEKPEDIIGKDDYSMSWREQAELYRADDRAVIESGKPKLMIEEPQTTPAGETIYLYTNKLPLLDARGNGIGVLGTYLDVTERRQAEEAIRESRQLFMDIISFLPDPTFVIDNDGKVLAWNRALEQLSGVPAGDIIGKGDYEYSLWQYGKRRPILIDLVHYPDEAAGRQEYTNIQREGRTVIAQTEIIQPGSGHKTTLLLVASPLIDTQGKITGAIESMRDISRLREAEAELARINKNLEIIVRDRTKALEDEVVVRKQAEAAIKESLDEKVILLREVHHRVKNNLQIIISLVNLQMRQTNDPGVKLIMSETQNRVRAMSLVHEKLYRSESLTQIDFADYTRFLATQLFSFFGMDSRRVRLDLAMGKIMVDINTAVPLGLIMNELVSNALKHAFPDNREGTISISGGEEGDLITLVVRDNGIGIPEALDWKNTTSLGLQLVTSLIGQIDGTITLDRDNGTAFTITAKRETTTGSTG